MQNIIYIELSLFWNIKYSIYGDDNPIVFVVFQINKRNINFFNTFNIFITILR